MIELDLQRASAHSPLPAKRDFLLWAGAALQEVGDAELTVRLVDAEESRALNEQYRGKDRSTNVLSFPADLPREIDLPLLGDVVICAPLVAEEARQQGKDVLHHWAHLTIHGILHLLGHDHQEAEEAREMEALETRLLAGLGIPSPWG